MMDKKMDGGLIKLTPFNNDDLIQELNNLGYKFSNVFKSPEIMAVYQTVLDYSANQNKMGALSNNKKWNSFLILI